MHYRYVIAMIALGLISAGVISGCSQKAPQVGPSPVPAVPVSQPVQREVTDYVDFTGRTDAIQAVDIRAPSDRLPVEIPSRKGPRSRKGTCSS